MKQVGNEGVIYCRGGQSRSRRSFEVVEGMQFDRGYISPIFIPMPRECRPSLRIYTF